MYRFPLSEFLDLYNIMRNTDRSQTTLSQPEPSTVELDNPICQANLPLTATTDDNKRFCKTSVDERDQLLTDADSANTKKATKYAVKTFKSKYINKWKKMEVFFSKK